MPHPFWHSFALSKTSIGPVLKTAWPLLLLVWVVSSGLGAYWAHLETLTRHLSGAPLFGASLPMALELAALATELLLSALVMITVPIMAHSLRHPTPPLQLLPFLSQRLHLLIIESLRALAAILRWGVLLILPGLYKQLRYYLVPYVVLFHPAYQRGDADALETADRCLHGSAFHLAGFLVITALIDYGLTQNATGPGLLQAPLQTLLWSALALLFDVMIALFLYNLFMDLQERNPQKGLPRDAS